MDSNHILTSLFRICKLLILLKAETHKTPEKHFSCTKSVQNFRGVKKRRKWPDQSRESRLDTMLRFGAISRTPLKSERRVRRTRMAFA